MKMPDLGKKILFFALLSASASPFIGTASALVMGIIFSLVLGNPWPAQSSAWSKKLLQISVVGLGFGQSIGQVWRVGRSSIPVTLVGISLILAAGLWIGRFFGTRRNTSTLISFGTAICGGSAIAAMAPVIKAEDDETALAMATVFTLNSVALLLFPILGHLMHLSQHQFGVWAALAIHDTSSVVGAAAAYGRTALDIGTTVKLARAFWIVPFVIGASWLLKSERKARIPLFIIGFAAAAAIRTLFPDFVPVWEHIAGVAKQALVVTLFLIGTGLTREVLQSVGPRPFAQGVTLWAAAGSFSLLVILGGLIS